MKAKVTAQRVCVELDALIAVWNRHGELHLGPDVTLTTIKSTRAEIRDSVARVAELKRQLCEAIQQRKNATRRGNQLAIRARNGIAGVFGLNSVEYAAAGGKRPSDRRKPNRKSRRLLLLPTA